MRLRREDMINKAFPLDRNTTAQQIRERRRVLGTRPAVHFLPPTFASVLPVVVPFILC